MLQAEFIEDFYSNDVEIRKILLEGTITTYKKPIFTSWPKPKKGQLIEGEYKGDYFYESAINYWNEHKYNIGDTIEVEFIRDYVDKSQKAYRISIDNLGRRISYPIHLDEAKNSSFSPYKKYSCYVIGFKQDGAPLIRENPLEVDISIYELNKSYKFEILKEYEIPIEDLSETHDVGAFRLIKDVRNENKFKVPRVSFQTGPQYKSFEGKSVEYKVVDFKNNRPIFHEKDLKNDYFLDIEDFDKIVQDFYRNHKNDVLIEAHIQLSNQNQYWVYTFINQLLSVMGGVADSYDLQYLDEICDVLISFNTSLIKNGWLSQFNQEIRKDRKRTFESEILHFSEVKKISQILKSDNLDNFIETISQGSQNKQSILGTVRIILDIFKTSVTYEQKEQMIELILASFEMSEVVSYLYHIISNTKSELRKSLFSESEFMDDDSSFIGNNKLKHLIFVENKDLEFQEFNKRPEAEKLLTQSSILRYEGLYDNDVKKIQESIDLLDLRASLFNSEKGSDEQKKFHREYLFALLHSNTYLAKKAQTTKETLKYLQRTKYISSKLRNLGAFRYQAFIEFYEIVDLFEKKKPISEIKLFSKNLIKKYEELDAQPNSRDDVKLTKKIEFFEEFIPLCKILSVLESNEIEDQELLLSISHLETKNNNLNINEIASFVLTDCLLKNFSEMRFINNLSEMILKGSVEMKYLFSDGSDESGDSKEEKRILRDINRTEDLGLELKASFLIGVKPLLKSGAVVRDLTFKTDSIRFAVLKNIAGMLNSNYGGSIYIGVLEMKHYYQQPKHIQALREAYDGIELSKVNILGLEKEIELLNSLEKKQNKQDWDIDKYNLHIQQIVADKLGEGVSNYVSYQNLEVRGRTIIKIQVKDNVLDLETKPFILCDEDNKDYMFIRRDGKVEKYTGTEEILEQFIKHKKVLGIEF